MIAKQDQKLMPLGTINSNDNSKFFEKVFTNESPKDNPNVSHPKDINRIKEADHHHGIAEADERTHKIEEQSHSQGHFENKPDTHQKEEADVKRDENNHSKQGSDSEKETAENSKGVKVTQFANSFKGKDEKKAEKEEEKEKESDGEKDAGKEVVSALDEEKLKQNNVKASSNEEEVKEKSLKGQEHSVNVNAGSKNNSRVGSFVELENQRTIGSIVAGDIMFDDKEGIGDKISTKIQKLEIWHHEESITGIQVTYQLSDGTLFQGKRYLDLRTSEQEYQVPWVFEKQEHIVKVIGRYSEEHGIEKLSIFTNEGIHNDYGNLNSKSPEFVVEFEEGQPPICIYGCRRLIHYTDKPDRTVISGLGFKAKQDEKKRWASRTQL